MFTQNLSSLPQTVKHLGIFRNFAISLKISELRMQKNNLNLLQHTVWPQIPNIYVINYIYTNFQNSSTSISI